MNGIPPLKSLPGVSVWQCLWGSDPVMSSIPSTITHLSPATLDLVNWEVPTCGCRHCCWPRFSPLPCLCSPGLGINSKQESWLYSLFSFISSDHLVLNIDVILFIVLLFKIGVFFVFFFFLLLVISLFLNDLFFS